MSRLKLAAVAALALAFCACGDSTSPPGPVVPDLQFASGDRQTGTVGEPLPTPVQVRVVDGKGRGLGGIPVEWSVASGFVDVTVTTTDISGYASTRWTLGTLAGTQEGVVVAAGERIAFQVTAAPGPLTNLAIVPGDVAARVGETRQLTFRGNDKYQNPIQIAQPALVISPATVATVTPEGLVRAAQIGHAQLTASIGGVVARSNVDVLLGWRSVSAGYEHTCGISDTGDSYCWGLNDGAQLGAGLLGEGPRPRLVGGGFRFANITAGQSESCAVTVTKTGYCWGNNINRTLGIAPGGFYAGVPAPLVLGVSFETISAGLRHRCGVTTEQRVRCWGELGGGLLSQPDTVTRRFSQVASGFGASCGLTPDGVVYCWGVNESGQLGNGTTTPATAPVRVVSSGVRFRHISMGGAAVCALSDTNVAYCWGARSGVGEAVESSSRVPAPIASELRFADISAGYGLTCGVTTDGKVYCWGGTLEAVTANGIRRLPVLMSGTTVASSVSAGRGHACWVTAAADLYCWGNNEHGQLGSGTLDPRVAPGLVTSPGA